MHKEESNSLFSLQQQAEMLDSAMSNLLLHSLVLNVELGRRLCVVKLPSAKKKITKKSFYGKKKKELEPELE